MTDDDHMPAGGGLTAAERQRMVERHVEVMTFRKVGVGRLLNRLKFD